MRIEEEIKQIKFRSAQQKAALNILYTASWLSGRHNAFFKKYEITGHQFNILRILRGQHPGKISVAEIKLRMLDRNSDVSRMLDRLITKKLILKSQCPKDKRATDVQILDKGLRVLAEIDIKMDSLDFLNALTAREATTLSDLLDKTREVKSPRSRLVTIRS
jgi:DNA-binding MarR family transcriptional regulator